MSTYIIHTARKAKKTDSIELVKDCLNLGLEVINEDGIKEIRYPKTV